MVEGAATAAEGQTNLDRHLLRLVLLIAQVREWEGLDQFPDFAGDFTNKLEECVSALEHVAIVRDGRRVTRVQHLRALAVRYELARLFRDVQLGQPEVPPLGETSVLGEPADGSSFVATFGTVLSFLVDAFTDDGFVVEHDQVEDALRRLMHQAGLDIETDTLAEWVRCERGPAEAAQRLMSTLGVGDRQRMDRLRKSEDGTEIAAPRAAHGFLGHAALKHIERLVNAESRRLGYGVVEQSTPIPHGDNVDALDDPDGHESE